MFGVLVNVITVIVGSLIGLLFKKGIPERVSKAAMIVLGACTLISASPVASAVRMF